MEALLAACLQGSCMVVFLALARRVLRGKVSSAWMVAAWIAVAVRLILPLDPASFVSSARTVFVSIGTTDAAQDVALPTVASTAGSSIAQALDVQGFSMAGLLSWVWLAGSLACATCTACRYARGRARAGRCFTAGTDTPADCLRGVRVRRHVRVRECGVASPLTYGVLRPVILVPTGFFRETGEREACLVLLHEVAHVRRFDSAVKLLLAGVTCLYWFDPLVWAMRALSNRDIELSCDEWALRGCDARDRSRYARMLVGYCDGPRPGRGLMPTFASSWLEERVGAVLQRGQASGKAALAVAASLALTVALSGAGAASLASADQLDVTVSTQYFSFEIPKEWQGLVSVRAENSTLYVYPTEHPNQWLLKFSVVSASAPVPRSTDGCAALLSEVVGDNLRVDVRALNYAGMSVGNLWATSFSSNPVYPGDAGESAVVELSTGGAYTAEVLHGMTYDDFDPEEGFSYYLEHVAAGIYVA